MDRFLQPLEACHAALIAGMHRVAFAEPWNEPAMTTLLAMAGSFGFLAHAERPEGFILCRAVADEAEVLTLLVLPPYRRRGLATALLAKAMGAARDLGVSAMFLEAAANNKAALALYSALGFGQVGSRTHYYADGTDALVLRCSLPPRQRHWMTSR